MTDRTSTIQYRLREPVGGRRPTFIEIEAAEKIDELEYQLEKARTKSNIAILVTADLAWKHKESRAKVIEECVQAALSVSASWKKFADDLKGVDPDDVRVRLSVLQGACDEIVEAMRAIGGST